MLTSPIAIDRAALASLKGALEGVGRAEPELSGLRLYYLLERATALSEFHMVLREGDHNRTRAGLMQSYGEHNRLLLHGLDKLSEGDLEWYRSRLERTGAVSDQRLVDCFAAVQALGLGTSAKIALWLGAALHDCGILAGCGQGVDVEDGVVLAAPLLDALCPEELRDLAEFAVRNHDYIKDLFRGEVPAGFIADQLAQLGPELQPTALALLGMIQVAGAASLGEGMLSGFRVSIFEHCVAGTTLVDRSTRTRLARLLTSGTETTSAPPTSAADEVLSALDDSSHRLVERFLERIPIHKWHRAWGSAADDNTRAKSLVLQSLAVVWDRSGAQHFVLETGASLPAAASTSWEPHWSEAHLGNGTLALLVR